MKYYRLLIIFSIFLFSFVAHAQTRQAVQRPPAKPAPSTLPAAVPSIDKGRVSDHTYKNDSLNFQLDFPEAWVIPTTEYLREHGLDVSIQAPPTDDLRVRRTLDTAISHVTLLLSVYKYLPGLLPNAVARVAVEDLRTQAQIKDAVDYVDAVRQTYVNSKMPTGVEFSETQAESLGQMQFAFIDIKTPDFKTRMYVTVRDRYAILFKYSYTNDHDLATFRDVLAKGNFSLK